MVETHGGIVSGGGDGIINSNIEKTALGEERGEGESCSSLPWIHYTERGSTTLKGKGWGLTVRARL